MPTLTKMYAIEDAINNSIRLIIPAIANQGHREFPFWKRKIPPAKEKIPENSRSVKCLILHALTQ